MPDSLRVFVGPSRLVVDIDGYFSGVPAPTTPGLPKGEIDIPPSQLSSYRRTASPARGYGIRYDSAGIEKDSLMLMQRPLAHPDLDEGNIPEGIEALDHPEEVSDAVPELDYISEPDVKDGEEVVL